MREGYFEGISDFSIMCVTCLYELLYNYLWPRLLHPNSADNSGAQRQRELGLKFLFQINDNWFSNNLFTKFLYDTLKVSVRKDEWSA